MRRKLTALVLLIVLVLAGCSNEVAYPFMQAEENIAAIEIIETPGYENPDDYSAFDAFVTIKQEDWPEFLAALRRIPCKRYFNDPIQGLSGEVIRITYADGYYEVIGPSAGLHIENGSKTWQDCYFDAEAFNELVRAEIRRAEERPVPSVYEYETVDGGIRILSHYYDEGETQIEVPEEIDGMKVVSLGPDAFYQHKSVVSITLSDNVKSLEGSPFYRCYSLKELVIPASVEKIDGNPVFRCSSLEKIEADPKNPFFSSVGGVLFNKEQTQLIAYPEGKAAESYTIPETVMEIDGDAFGYHTQFKKLTIPASVTVFPDGNMFVFPEDIVLYVEAGSAAENYAKEYELKYEIIE